MSDYRVYFVDAKGKIFAAVDIQAETDADAITSAEHLAMARTAAFEVWQRARRVHVGAHPIAPGAQRFPCKEPVPDRAGGGLGSTIFREADTPAGPVDTPSAPAKSGGGGGNWQPVTPSVEAFGYHRFQFRRVLGERAGARRLHRC